MNLQVPIVFALAGVIFLFLAILGKFEIRDKVIIPNLPDWSRICMGVVSIAFIGIAIWLFLQPSPVVDDKKPLPEPPIAINSKYSFEDGLMGWIPQDYEDSRACVQVFQSDDIAKDGRYSLKMIMDLIGGDTHKSKGEAWVIMRDNPPVGERVPINLTGRTITGWVYAPQGSRGDRSKPNGFQLFVKDENWKNEYGPWSNVVEGQWKQISLTVSTSKPRDGYVDEGFNPSAIIALGVKMGSGGGSTEKFNGSVYIDAIDW